MIGGHEHYVGCLALLGYSMSGDMQRKLLKHFGVIMKAIT